MKNIAIVTGASSGMGREFALKIDRMFKNIDEIWIIARRLDRPPEKCETFLKKVIFLLQICLAAHIIGGS